MGKIPGSELRDNIINLLKLQYSIVEPEYKVCNKSADIFYIDDTNPLFQNVVAIECKDWASPLSSHDLRDIYHEYFPAISSSEIDRLIIIGKHELGKEPAETIRKLDRTSYVSYDNFITSLMNFSYLLQDNILSFRQHESYKNFLTSKVLGSSQTIEEHTRHWLSGNEGVLLIYGGYGIGKSSFSLHLTAKLSEEFRKNDFKRIPIRISLGGLYHKQDLKSLIASSLSGADGAASVRNFSYSLFLEMVRLGYFLVILDGFDEMRHAMGIDDFEYTFSEFSALFEGDAKTIILGRPDSFFTDDEEDRVIRSTIGSKTEFSKVEISMLDRNQVQSYVDNHISKNRKSYKNLDDIESFCRSALESEIDIVSRPVQLKMFISVMERLSAKGPNFNRYDLYFYFIYNFARREDEKKSRNFEPRGEWKYGYSDARTVFMQEIAWWVLAIKRENRFLPREIPWDLVPRDLRNNADKDNALREIILGSVIEPNKAQNSNGPIQVKGQRFYYFPHKSYIEFLVAEYFCRKEFSREMYADFFEFANSEILSFIEEGPDNHVVNIRKGLEFARGTISARILKIAARDPQLSDEKQQLMDGKGSAGRLYVFYHWLISGNGNNAEIENFLFSSLLNASSLNRCATAYAMIVEYLGRIRSDTLCKRVLVFCFERIGAFGLTKLYDHPEGAIIYTADANAVHMSFLAEAIELGKSEVRVDMNNAKSIVKILCRSSLYVGEYDARPSKDCKTYIFGQELIKPVGEDTGKLLRRYIEGETVKPAKVSIKGNLN